MNKRTTEKSTKQPSKKVTNQKSDFLDMIIQGLEQLEEREWEHYLKAQIDFIPKNLFTKIAYTRYNRLTLFLDMLLNQFTAPFYATFKQISHAGGKLRKGARSRIIQYYNYIVTHKEAGKRIPFSTYKKLAKDEQEAYDVAGFIKYFRVFNVVWVDNPEELNIAASNEEAVKEINSVETSVDAEVFINNLQSNKALVLKHENTSVAYYSLSNDCVTLPRTEWFKDDVKYYSTLFHELIHWTGHPARLDRLKAATFNEKYAQEELIAEIGAMLVYFDYNFKDEFTNSLVYLKGWLKQTSKERDKKIELTEAFRQANTAVNFLYY